MNKFRDCPKCGGKLNTRTSRDMLPDGSRREVYRVCKACKYSDVAIVRREIIFVSCCDDKTVN